MKKVVLVILYVIFFTQANGQKYVVWASGLGTSNEVVATFKDKNILFAVNYLNNGVFLQKINAENGSLLWNKALLTTSGTLYVTTAKKDSLFNFYITGALSTTTGLEDAFLIKSDSSGNLSFLQTFNGIGNRNDRFNDVDIDKNLNVFVVGETNAGKYGTDPLYPFILNRRLLLPPSLSFGAYGFIPDVASGSTDYVNSKILVAGYSSNGTSLWTTSFTGTYALNAIGSSIKTSSNGQLYIAGIACNERDSIVYKSTIRYNNVNYTDTWYKNYFFWGAVVRKIDPSTGATIWEHKKVYNGPNTRISSNGGSGSPMEGDYLNDYKEIIIGLTTDSIANPVLITNYARYYGPNYYDNNLSSNQLKFKRISSNGQAKDSVFSSIGSFKVLDIKLKYHKKSIYIGYSINDIGLQEYRGYLSRFDKNFNKLYTTASVEVGPSGGNFSTSIAFDIDSANIASIAYTYQTLQSWYPYGIFINRYTSTGTLIKSLNVYKQVSSVVKNLLSDNNGSVYVGGRFANRLVRFCFSDIPDLPISQRICIGQSVSIISTASGVTNYLWTPSIGVSNTASGITFLSPTTTTSYNLKVAFKDGCIHNLTTSVQFRNPMPVINLRADTSLCIGDSVFLQTNRPYPSIQWSNGKTTTGIWVKATISSQKIKVLAVDSCNNRSSDSLLVKGSNCIPTKLVDFEGTNGIVPYPNPVIDKVFFFHSSSAEIVSQNGVVLLSCSTCNHLDTSELLKGSYILKSINPSGVFHFKVFKE